VELAMTNKSDYIEVLAKSLAESDGLVWDDETDHVMNNYRRDMHAAVVKLEEADFVIVPKQPTEEILRVLFGQGLVGISPSQLYEKIVEARPK
jgi:hypothetical protein